MIMQQPSGSTPGFRDFASEIDPLIGAKTLFQQSFSPSRANFPSLQKD
jgi:hypothetical protein